MKRPFRALIATLGWAGLSLQLALLLRSGAYADAAHAIWYFLAYFTVLTNLLIAGVMTVSALAPGTPAGRFVEGANIRAALLLAIGLVGIVYHLLLTENWQPGRLDLLSDIILHTVIPLLVLADWLLFARKDGLSFRALPFYFAWPLLYSVYIQLRARLDGFYPYPFLDAASLGYPRVALNIIAMGTGFAAGAALLILLGRHLDKMHLRQPA